MAPNDTEVWRTALGRLAGIFAVVIGATAAISLALGALGHDSLSRSLAVGYYVVGCGALIGCLGFGLRGPRRREYVDTGRPAGPFSFGRPRIVRNASGEERSDARRNSVLFFAFGLFLVALGAAFDPARSLF